MKAKALPLLTQALGNGGSAFPPAAESVDPEARVRPFLVQILALRSRKGHASPARRAPHLSPR